MYYTNFKKGEKQMKVPLKIWVVALLLAFFAAGCGCGGDEAPSGLVSIEVTPVNPSIALGTHQQFTATGIFSDNARQDITNSVTWSSAVESVATISNETGSNGLAASRSVGSSTVTATLGSISGSTTLTVTTAVLVSIVVTPENSSVGQGAHQQFTATGTFSDNTTQDITKSAHWSSSDTTIATIGNTAGSKGLAVTVAAGSTTITATSGGISGSTLLTVSGAKLVSITVTPATTFAGFNTTVQYTAVGTFSDNTSEDITNVVTWSSSDPSIATISNEPGSKGLATTDHRLGSTTITATLGDVSGSALLIDP